jgi:pyruvate dehydrogenase E2 component (dihydrolipoamide acetyltransferase)
MATEIKMPQLSDTMYSGKILSWNKQEGDQISRGDILAEVETDKANLEIESFHNGTLLKILTPANETADVGNTIAYIGEPGEAVPTSSAPASSNGAAKAAPAEPVAIEAETPAPIAETAAPEAPTTAAQPGGRIKASPLAKKIAAQRNIDLASVQGSGPDGRIVKKDVEAATSQTTAPATAPTPAPTQPATPARQSSQASGPVPGTLQPMSKIRETIARRMQQSVNEAPHFYVTATVDMEEAMRLRAILKEKPAFKGISVNHLIIKAVAYGIRNEPRVNYTVRDETSVFQPAQINVGIITALDEGLLIPVVREADKLSLQDVVFEARAAVERDRAGRPSSSDLVGGTFSISNMGMFDVENFTAIINPGQGSVLAVSSVKEMPVVKNGAIVPGKLMKATVSVDHRIIDGVMAGNFLRYFKEALETPALLMN